VIYKLIITRKNAPWQYENKKNSQNRTIYNENHYICIGQEEDRKRTGDRRTESGQGDGVIVHFRKKWTITPSLCPPCPPCPLFRKQVNP